jgi:hypothetical protein
MMPTVILLGVCSISVFQLGGSNGTEIILWCSVRSIVIEMDANHRASHGQTL